MTESLRSSSEVLDFLDDLDRSFIEQYPDEGPKMLERGHFIAERIKISRVEFSDDIIPALNELSTRFPDLFVGDLDRLYVREVVAAVPGCVSRTLQLSGLAPGRKPKSTVAKYLSEAVRSYIYGFPLASIALSRAVLELAIKECVVNPPEDRYLSDWIDQVVEERALDGAIAELARSVESAGNKVLHQKPVGLPEAFAVLANVRKFLEALYPADQTE
jgi:hypothetical protein